MIVKAITDQAASLPKKLHKYAFTQDDKGKLDISVGKHYAVYAISDIHRGRRQYFVHTDNDNVKGMWWMPAELYEVVNATQPQGWRTNEIDGQTLLSYPSLTQWKVAEGIIDGENAAIDQYMSEVQADPTFPTQEQLDDYNADFYKQAGERKYQEELKMARERGWEPPEPPK